MNDVVFFVLLLSLVAFLGCVQNPPAGITQTGDVLLNETSEIETGLDDFSDLQNSLEDTAIDDSGIDENSFS